MEGASGAALTNRPLLSHEPSHPANDTTNARARSSSRHSWRTPRSQCASCQSPRHRTTPVAWPLPHSQPQPSPTREAPARRLPGRPSPGENPRPQFQRHPSWQVCERQGGRAHPRPEHTLGRRGLAGRPPRTPRLAHRACDAFQFLAPPTSVVPVQLDVRCRAACRRPLRCSRTLWGGCAVDRRARHEGKPVEWCPGTAHRGRD
mmetsp:Transcript_19645/g.52390  ORF Transcript_19645/g.52390 Transcript_19645/m.52390 type:complete len:204 (+) Transcript_19645:125-736(+)